MAGYGRVKLSLRNTLKKNEDEMKNAKIALIELCVAAAALAAHGAYQIWNGPVEGLWSGPNWSSGYFAAGDTAVFQGEGAGSPEKVKVDADVTAGFIRALSPVQIDLVPGELHPVAYRFFRFKIEGTKTAGNNMMQVSELKLFDENGADITQNRSGISFDPTPYNSRATWNYDNATWPFPSGEKPEKLVDGTVDTKWLDGRVNATDAETRDATYTVIEFANPQRVTKYEWYTANDAKERDPAAWRLQASNDGLVWVDLEVVSGYNCTDNRKALAYTGNIKYMSGLGVDEIEVAEGQSAYLTFAPKSRVKKTGLGRLVASAALPAGVEMHEGSLSLAGAAGSFSQNIVVRETNVAFYDGTYNFPEADWKPMDNAPDMWVIGAGAIFNTPAMFVVSPESSSDRTSTIRLENGGRFTVAGNVYLQNHDLGLTRLEVTGDGSEFRCNGALWALASNDAVCQTPRCEIVVSDGGNLYSNGELNFGRRNTKFAVNPFGLLFVTNASIHVNSILDFGTDAALPAYHPAGSSLPLATGRYEGRFVDAYIWAQRIWVGRDRSDVTVYFDNAIYESRANSSDFIMQHVDRTDAPFVLGPRGLVVLTQHNTVLKGSMRGEGPLVKRGRDKIDVSYDQFFTGRLVCDEGTINNTSGRTLTFAAGGIEMNGGTVNFSDVDFTNEVISVAINGGTLHLFDNGKTETRRVSTLKLGEGVRLNFDVSSDGVDSFTLDQGGTVILSSTAENPAVLAPNVLSALPVNTPYTLVSGGFSQDDLAKVVCAEEGYVLSISDSGALMITHSFSTHEWTGGDSNGNWSGDGWNGEQFTSGDNAVFAHDGDVAHLDRAFTVGTLTATANARITADEWVDPTPKFRRFRFHVFGTKYNNDMMQLSEIEFYDGWTKMSPARLEWDKTDLGITNGNYPGNESPDLAADGKTGTKWLDRRGGNARTDAQKALCYLDFVYDEPFALTRYRWYTANDSQDRDPFNWEVLGYDETAGTWVLLDRRLEENVTELRMVLAGTWDIEYNLPERPTLKVSEYIDVAAGKTLIVDAPFGSSFVKRGDGTLKVTQSIENGIVLESGGLDLGGNSFGFTAADLSADGVVGFYNGAFLNTDEAFNPGAHMPRVWTIGEGAVVSGPNYADFNVPEDGEQYTLLLDGGTLSLGSATSWFNCDGTGYLNFVVTNSATARFGGNFYCAASNRRVLDVARTTIDVVDGALLEVGSNFTFGRENTQHPTSVECTLNVRNARVYVARSLDLGADDTTQRAGYYHLNFGEGALVEANRIFAFNDRDDTRVVFDGATMASVNANLNDFIGSSLTGVEVFSIGEGGFTISNEHAVAVTTSIGGEGSLTKKGAAMLRFTAPQTFTGQFVIEGPVDFNGQTFASSGAVLASGGAVVARLGANGFTGLSPLPVAAITATKENPFRIDVTYDVDVTRGMAYDLFPNQTGWSEEDVEKIAVNGLNLVVINGRLFGMINPEGRTWSNAGGDSLFSTDANWTGNVAPNGSDWAIFPLASGGVATNDYASLSLLSMQFPEGAGAFMFEGNPIDLRGVTNLSESVQTFNMPVVSRGMYFNVGGTGDFDFAGGLQLEAGALFVKGGEGTTVLHDRVPGGMFDLAGGTLELRGIPDGARTNPLVATADALRLAGRLDLGGATQAVTITPANGDNLFYGGFELVNGTINLTASGYVMPRGDMTIGAGGVLNIPGAAGKTQGSFCMSMPAVGDTMRLTIKDGGELNEHSLWDNAYIGDGTCAKAIVEVSNNGFYHVDSHSTELGLNGCTGIIHGEGGRIDFNSYHKLFMVGRGGGEAHVALTNTWFLAGFIFGGHDRTETFPARSNADFEMVGGTLKIQGFVVRNINSWEARLDGVQIDNMVDNADFFNCSIYAGSNDPFVLGPGGITFLNAHETGITTSLAGPGGVTVNGGTFTVSKDQKYTGTTTIKNGTRLAAAGRSFAGPVVFESGATFESPELPQGRTSVRVMGAPSFVGVDMKTRDADGNHYFYEAGWLMYGQRPGFFLILR